MAGEELVQRWVRRLRQEVPGVVAVLLAGSHVRGDAGPGSDLDFDVLVDEGPRDELPAWFDTDGPRLVRMEAWVRDVDQWLASQRESQDWAFGLAAAEPLRPCWVADGWRSRLERSRLLHPAAEPELDHFLGDLGKLANARRRGDELALRLAAQDLARSCPTLLQPLNPHPPVASRHEALLAALEAAVAPPGYRDDLLVCLGLGRPTGAEQVHAAAARLAAGVVALLEAHADTYAPLLSHPQATSLGDGSLRAYVAQLLA